MADEFSMTGSELRILVKGQVSKREGKGDRLLLWGDEMLKQVQHDTVTAMVTKPVSVEEMAKAIVTKPVSASSVGYVRVTEDVTLSRNGHRSLNRNRRAEARDI